MLYSTRYCGSVLIFRAKDKYPEFLIRTDGKYEHGIWFIIAVPISQSTTSSKHPNII
jgi:hypothetical protein